MFKRYYTYIDITSDDRPFYVGKGNKRRLKNVKPRNVIWKNIVAKHGHKKRIIVFETLVERWALDREVELIALLKTHHGLEGHWGSNLTDGGEGVLNASPESKLKMSEKRRRREPPSEFTRKRMADAQRKCKGEKRSEITRQRLSIAASKRRLSDVEKANLSKTLRGQKRSLESRKNISEGVKAYWAAHKASKLATTAPTLAQDNSLDQRIRPSNTLDVGACE